MIFLCTYCEKAGRCPNIKLKIGKILKIALIILALTALTGCYSKSSEELYHLPQMSPEYLQLQKNIDNILANGAEYAAPTAGEYRQSVQLEDIDNDGTKEAIAFFNVPGDDQPLKIYVFECDGDKYTQAAVIEGDGTSIDRIEYADMDGDGMEEIIVGWQISTDVKMMSVYSLRNYQITVLSSVDYTEFKKTDLQGDKNPDMLVVNISASEQAGSAELISLSSSGDIVSSDAKLSPGVESLSRIKIGYLEGGIQAVFVESTYDDGEIITDVLTCRNEKLVNISADESTGVSSDTLRSYNVYCTDIDGDGFMEVPFPVALPSETDGNTYWLIQWHDYTLQGKSLNSMTTFHDFSDGWYFTIPSEWADRITVYRDDVVSGERAIVFAAKDDGEDGAYEPFLIVYSLSGENKDERSAAEGRFVLDSESETIYAAELLPGTFTSQFGINEDTVKNNFKIIYSEWVTGET